MSTVELNEKLLMDAGGWQAMKLARALWEAGRVVSSNYTPPVLKGLVSDAGTEFRAGLKIVSRTNVENICSCRPAREWGTICAHSLAVGIAVLKPKAAPVLKSLPPGPVAAASSQPAEQGSELGQPQFSLTVEGSLNQLTARLQATYDRRVVTVGLTPGHDLFSYANPGNPERRLGRNVAAERQALERLTRWGFAGPDTVGQFALKREPAILNFFARELPLLQKEWDVTVGARFSNITQGIERITPRLDIQSSGENWFEISVQMETPGGQIFSAAEIQRLLQMGQNHVRLKNDRLAVFDVQMLDELQNVLVDCDPQQKQAGHYRVDRIHAGYIDAVVGTEAKITGTPDWRQWARAQRQLDAPQPILLGALENVLRAYQKEGVYWMNFLAKNGFGGILADEMGLGKTLQALAFLRSLGGRSLIVCPSSLVYNWQREAARFTPEQKTLAITGPDREALFAKIPEADLILTSYALLRRDGERYRAFEFAAAILDEAQHIKNPETQNAQAAVGLRARTRFVLTGTPMENSVRDLWSIMEFVLPGYLGSKTDFRERYEQPINQEGSASVRQRLSKRIRPFILRRLKKSVATELPDKIEQVIYCELNANQASAYQELLKEGQNRIAEIASTKNEGQTRMLMLTTLLRLRQTCCDLRLLNLPQITGPTSGKLDMLDELLREIMDGGHRVLIFSQFVSMLHLIRDHLSSAEIPCCYLDGGTKDRASEVDRFQNNGDLPVFLISLKAGGVGLNLTAADTVIHFDPWWNPAVEAQATDRAHRIGQRNIVTSYKLITRGTVEEKILNLQQKKRALIDATLESEEPIMSGLTMEEISSLLN